MWTKRQRKALEGSIKKWVGIKNGSEIDHGVDNCSCCDLYHNKNCNHCPVAMYTESTMCTLTPYMKWSDYWWDHYNISPLGHTAISPEEKQLAQDEIDYLNKVLEAG